MNGETFWGAFGKTFPWMCVGSLLATDWLKFVAMVATAATLAAIAGWIERRYNDPAAGE